MIFPAFQPARPLLASPTGHCRWKSPEIQQAGALAVYGAEGHTKSTFGSNPAV